MGKIKDLTNMRFGNLTALSYRRSERITYWKCKCDCGNFREVNGTLLTSGKVTGCKNCMKKLASKHLSIAHRINLTGMKYGRLTVICKVPNKNKRTYWHCKCDCGNEIDVLTQSLTNGNTKSCGCLHTEIQKQVGKNTVHNLTGRRFGKLLVICRERNDGILVRWKCKCDCGNTCVVNAKELLKGDTRSCGCLTVNFDGSLAENNIKNYIVNMIGDNVEISKEKVLKYSDNIQENKEIDIYIPSYNLGIEYNGSVFHASVNGLYSDKPKYYHRDKFLQAKKQGIHLINIFDVDWNNNQDKIKMYLKSLINPNIKIYARNCKCTQVPKTLARDFCDKYHLQNHAHIDSIFYGLYYNDIMVSIMTFGKLRLSKQKDSYYELHRYCVKDGYCVLGGATKLLCHFERDYNPVYIRSYSDNDYFTGGIYKIMGFYYSGQCTPRYYWYTKEHELKRERCQLKHLKILYPELYNKSILYKVNNKEDYIMSSIGARKIYRSGTTKWEKLYNT